MSKALLTDATLTGNGTPNALLGVVSSVFPYYYPQFTYKGTFSTGNQSVTANGTFFHNPSTYLLCLTYVDIAGTDHQNDIRKLDYSSIIHIYSANKKKKNRYVFTEASINISNTPNYIVIAYDPNQVNEEFTLTTNETYSFEFLLNALQDVEDLRNSKITNPQNGQVYTYDNGNWINKVTSANKAFLNIGWFNDIVDSVVVNNAYYFPWAANGTVYGLVGPTFYAYANVNTSGILTTNLITNKCGFKNVSGVTKSFFILGKCTGRPTISTWVSCGLINASGVQIRQARTNNICVANDAISLSFTCVLSMANNDEAYFAGCMHAGGTAYHYLTNMFLTVMEI